MELEQYVLERMFSYIQLLVLIVFTIVFFYYLVVYYFTIVLGKNVKNGKGKNNARD